MSKRKASMDIYPNEREDGSPASSRLKIGHTENPCSAPIGDKSSLSSSPSDIFHTLNSGICSEKGFPSGNGFLDSSIPDPSQIIPFGTSTPILSALPKLETLLKDHLPYSNIVEAEEDPLAESGTSKLGPVLQKRTLGNFLKIPNSNITEATKDNLPGSEEPIIGSFMEEHMFKKPNSKIMRAKKVDIGESGPSTEEMLGGSKWDVDPTTMRSQNFMKNMAELNRSFVRWITSCVEDDPTAILTRVFIDHQRQAQALFDEEREHTIDLDRLLVLHAQEKVLQQLKETSNDDSSSSNNTNTDSVTSILNGTLTPGDTSSVTITPANFSSPIGLAPKDAFNPFLKNSAVNGTNSFGDVTDTDKANAASSYQGPKTPGAVAEKPANFSAFSFASACTEAAAKAAAAKEKEAVEEVNEDAPPKVEFTPVQEEGAVFTKRCKIFFKKEKEEGYEDRGIGNLFVKPVDSTNRHQLIVRSETSLGNLLVNVLLHPDLPITKMGDKNVMLVMVPIPGSAVRIVMVRMKDGADELVEMLKKFSTI